MNARNHTIDILKGFCIILVIMTHHAGKMQRTFFLQPFWVDMAVPMFMIISGYVYANSYLRAEVNSLEDAYEIKFVINKIIRYTIPYIIAYILEVFAAIALNKYSVTTTINKFFVGGVGPGSYYYPIMIQFIFIYPLIYFVIKRYQGFGVLLCGISNALYEFLGCVYEMNTECYRLLIFRYIFLIGFGCFLAVGKGKFRKELKVISFAAGTIYITTSQYFDKNIAIINKDWGGVSYAAALYLLPIARIFLLKDWHCRPLELIGKASYNIFLVQMVYFQFLAGGIYPIIERGIVKLIMTFCICISAGIAFYYMETPITKAVVKQIDKSVNHIRLDKVSQLFNAKFTK